MSNHKRFKKLEKFFESPKVKLVLGIVLMLSALLEAIEIGLERVMGFEFGVHHGMLLFAFAKIGEAGSKIGIELLEIKVGSDEISKELHELED